MKIYVIHSAYYDYQNELYKPLRESTLNQKHEIKFPYEEQDTPVSSKEIIKDSDLIIAEVSEASTGMGIELGWADAFNIPIVCIYKKGSKVSRSLRILTDKIVEYESSEELVEKIQTAV